MAGSKVGTGKSGARGKAAPAKPRRAAAVDAAPELHLIKLCVGVSDIAELGDWQKERRRKLKRRYNIHVTRSFPRRSEALLAGGSLYWVIGGRIRVRQRLIGLVARRDEDGIPRCELRLDPKLVEVSPRPHRAFQGWRYLETKDAPPDLSASGRRRGDKLPPALEEELRALGLL
ncbi:MAG: DUF1489 domain-containing protein [Alphaproteobacteria bacterium]|nr:DUF1489 domain-containing protein [Alphaproteobacteria bacterium]